MKLGFREERIKRIVRELKDLSIMDKSLIEEVYKKDGFYKTREEADQAEGLFEAFHKDQLWGGKDVYAWFTCQLDLPELSDHEKLVYRLETLDEGWDALNPQGLLFFDGKVVQGLDVNHRTCPIPSDLKGKIQIDVQGYGGSSNPMSGVKGKSLFQQFLLKVDDRIEKLYYDMKIPLEVAELQREDSREKLYLLDSLEQALQALDLRKPYSEDFYKGIGKADQILADMIYNKDFDNNEIAACVGHTHIDVAWLWDLNETRQKVQRSFATVLKNMEDYPEYVFMSSQPQLYQFLKEERPELYDRVKERVAEGRWEPEGAMWVEADCNLSSGESFIRQIIYGKQFFRNEFGVENRVLWLPDVFGYSAALPQILRKCGVDYFMTTKISWNEYNKIPYDTLKWIGIDGTDVLAHFITTTDVRRLAESHTTTYNGYLEPASVIGAWERYQQKDINNEVLISYGYGDGGGGPTAEMIETGIRMEKGIPGSPKVSMTGSLDFFESLEKRLGDNKKLPKWVGELYLEYHRGTLTSMARNKRYNRISEHLYQELEWLWSLAVKECQVEYPGEILKKGWEIICLNQFHDIIPGSSIKKVYEDSKVQYEEILEIGKNLKEQAMKAIVDHLDIQEPSIVAFNALGFNRNQVATIKIEDRLEDVYLEDIPSKGYKVFKIEDLLKAKASTRDESQEANLGVLVNQERMENNFIRLELNDQGYISRLYDKINDREVFVDGAMGNVFQAFEDKPHNWDAWDINIYYQEKMWEVNGLISVEVLDTSEYKGSLRIKRRYQDSEISQIMTIYHDTPRIDFETEVDWNEKQVLLKTAFPVDVHSDKATYDIQFGNIERPTHGNTSWDAAKFEVCAHKWADLSEGDYGVSLLNNCKYGYDVTDRQMRLTLIKSPTAPNEDADREVHYFTYSLYPHKGDLRHSQTIKEGYALNQPLSLYEVVGDSHELEAKKNASMEFSLISTDQDNIVIETVKQAEYSNDIVFRVYETANSRTKARFSLGYDIVEVVSCDFEERVDYTCLDSDGSSFTDLFQPFEIKTYKVKFA